MSGEADQPHLVQRGWPALRSRLFHAYFLLTRPMTLGVRAMIVEPDGEGGRSGRVFLIRHTYVPGLQLPGGGVERGETAEEALRREVMEEANIAVGAMPALRSIHQNRVASPRDHVAFYVIEDFILDGPKLPDHEISEAGFFETRALPQDVTAATRRRIAEVFDGVPPSPYW